MWYEHQIPPSLPQFLFLLPKTRALSSVGLLMMLSTLVLLFEVVGIIPPVMAEH